MQMTNVSGARTSAAKKQPHRRIAARVFLNPGSVPGTLNPIADSAPATVSVLSGTDNGFTVKTLADLTSLPRPANKGLHWVRVVGLGKVEPLLTIAEFYAIRHLSLEDILSRGWRTKLEPQGDFAFFMLQAPPTMETWQKGDHLSLFCRQGLIITFEESPTKLVDSLWERLQSEPPSEHMKLHHAELLTHMVLDIMVDAFFPHLDVKDEILADLEDSITDHVPTRQELSLLHTTKRNLITLRRLLLPFKEVLVDLQKIHSPEAVKEFRLYFNDLNDHIVHAGELLDTYYEVAKSLDEISQTSISNRMNDIIKILTLISTVFMPLSFIAGLYGMNFNTESPLNMPELNFAYGYPLVLLFMAGVAGVMLWFFKKRDWI
ncbi:magnesium transport protein CorA [Deltaproteobacteria bacterium]|nr:magnesium transport protein CorA [Deltaproteobacteria bacterium]